MWSYLTQTLSNTFNNCLEMLGFAKHSSLTDRKQVCKQAADLISPMHTTLLDSFNPDSEFHTFIQENPKAKALTLKLNQAISRFIFRQIPESIGTDKRVLELHLFKHALENAQATKGFSLAQYMYMGNPYLAQAMIKEQEGFIELHSQYARYKDISKFATTSKVLVKDMFSTSLSY